MDEKSALEASSLQPQISRQQFDALLASHKAFHEVAIRVTDILLDPSRTAHYQSLPYESDNDTNVSYNRKANRWKTDISRQKDDGLGIAIRERVPVQSMHMPARVEISAERIFEIENTRARKAYSQKQQRSYKMYARASGSHINAEYDFQCMPSSRRSSCAFVG